MAERNKVFYMDLDRFKVSSYRDTYELQKKKITQFSVKMSDKHHVCNLLLNDLEKTIKHIKRKY